MAGAAPVNLPPDVDLGPMVLGLLWGTTALSFVVVGLRAYVRITTKAQGWDDYVAYIALANVIFGAVANQKQVHYGFGRHLVYVLRTAQEMKKWTIISEIQSYSAVFLVKLSVSLFILRVIKGTHRKEAIFIYFLITLIAMLALAAILTDTIQCFPLAKAWRQELEGTCVSSQVLTRLTQVFGAIGCVTDFACVIIGTLVFRRLQINTRKKMAFYIIVGLGLITAACAIGKSVTSSFQSDDPSYDFVPVEIWAGFEGNFGLTVACIPALWPLFVRMFNSTTRGSKRLNPSPYAKSKFAHLFLKLGSNNHTLNDQPSEPEGDRKKLVSLRNITVNRTMEVESELRRSMDMDMESGTSV